MSPQQKLLNHPLKEDIIRMLVEGTPVRDVAEFIRVQYPGEENAHLRVSWSTIQNFKKTYLDLDGRISADVRQTTQRLREETRVEEGRQVVEGTSAYQEKINEIVQSKIDVQRELVLVFKLLESRVEKFYNLMSTHEFPDTREERVFQGYIDQLIKLLESYKKYVEGYSESVEHNVNINIMNDQVVVIRDAVREALEEAAPDLAVKFMNNLNNRMNKLEFRQPGQMLGEAVVR